MFVCPICKKKFENLDEYTKHINEENSSDKKNKQQAIDAEKKALADKIQAKYSELKQLITEFNKKYTKEYYASELKHVNKRDFDSSNFLDYSSASNGEFIRSLYKILFDKE